MWDWELMKKGTENKRHDVISQYKHEDFQYTHAISYSAEQDEYCLHNHAMYELVYCLAGHVSYQAEGVRYAMEAGGLLIISPAVMHKLFVTSSEAFERHTLFINYFGKPSAIANLISQCQQPMGDKRIGSAYYAPSAAQSLRTLFDSMSKAANSRKENLNALTPYFAQAVLSQLLLITAEQNPQQCSVSAGSTIDTLQLYLSRNFTQDISLSDIADRFFLSKDYCNRLFHKATGMTVMQYVLYNRVLYAKHLLADGLPASEVSKQVGFSDYSNFYRSYKKITGRTPSDDHRVSENEDETDCEKRDK